MTPAGSRRRGEWVALVALGVAMVVCLAVFPKWSPDDAYILLRYADHWANAGAPSWNLGEAPVEGYTGILLLATLALASKARLSAYVVAKVLGAVALVLGGWVLSSLLSRLRVRSDVRLVTLLCYATAPAGFAHALSGLETMVYATLVGASLLCWRLAVDAPSWRSHGRTVVSLLAVSLARPEGVACALVVFLGITFAQVKRGASPSAWLALFGGGFVAPGGAYFLWRWRYYGRLLPNTYYAKLGVFTDAPEFGPSLLGFLDEYLGGLLLAAAASIGFLALVHRNRLVAQARGRLPEALALVAVVGPPFWQYRGSYLAMDYVHRFAFHYAIPLLAGLAVVLSDSLDALLSPPVSLRGRVAYVLVALLALSQAVTHAFAWRPTAEWVSAYRRMNEDEHGAAGEWLRRTLPATARVATLMDAGLVGYRSGLSVVDFGRLNDRYLADAKRTVEQSVDYFFARQVDALVVTSYSTTEVEYVPLASAIVHDPRFARYARARTFSSPGRRYHELVFLRRAEPERGEGP